MSDIPPVYFRTKLPSPRPLIGDFLLAFRSRWYPIALSNHEENHSTIDRPANNFYCRTGSKSLTDDGDVRVTEPFVTRSGDYLNVIMRWWLRRYGWLLWLPVAGVAVAGVILRDERIAIVALLMVFIIMPMVMLFIYIYYMLTPRARRIVLRKRIVIADGRYMRLEYLPEPCGETEAADGENPPDIPSGEDVFILPEDEIIPWNEVAKVSSTSRFMVFILRGKPRQLILIPYSSLKQ